jgi:hypothetical protein
VIRIESGQVRVSVTDLLALAQLYEVNVGRGVAAGQADRA